MEGLGGGRFLMSEVPLFLMLQTGRQVATMEGMDLETRRIWDPSYRPLNPQTYRGTSITRNRAPL